MNNILEKPRVLLSQWIDSAADLATRLQEALTSIRAVELAEQADGTFLAREPAAQGVAARLSLRDGAFLNEAGHPAVALLRGARVSLALRSDRFLFRTLDLPAKAGEFVDGVIRAQIDRLTPWTPSQAAFGHDRPAHGVGDRISVTLAATSLTLIEPLLRALRGIQAHSIVVLTRQPDADPAQPPIQVYETEGHVREMRGAARRKLVGAGAAALAFAGLSGALAGTAGAYLDSQLDEVAAQTRAWRQTQSSTALDPDAALHKRKSATPLATLALEALSRLLPDDTYLKDMQIIGDKIEMSGVTRDAAKLIRLIEQVPTFTQATFSGPTTRAPNETGEQFHIEARLRPRYALDK